MSSPHSQGADAPSIEDQITRLRSLSESTPRAELAPTHLARSGSNTTMEVSTDLLASLVLSVDSMKKEMALLKVDNNAMREDIIPVSKMNQSLGAEMMLVHEKNQSLEIKLALAEGDLLVLAENTGSKFCLFRKLPVELQMMIWRQALAPLAQVIALRSVVGTKIGKRGIIRGISAVTQHSGPSPIRAVNKQSRSVASSMQTAHWYKDVFSTEETTPVLSTNPATHVLWLTDRAVKHGGFQYSLRSIYHDLAALLDKESTTNTVAFDYYNFGGFIGTRNFQFMEDLVKLKVRRIILVVNTPEDAYTAADVVFIEPKKAPLKGMAKECISWFDHRAERFPDLQWKKIDSSVTWSDMSQRARIIVNEQIADVETLNAATPKDYSLHRSMDIRFMAVTTITELAKSKRLASWTSEQLKKDIVPAQ